MTAWAVASTDPEASGSERIADMYHQVSQNEVKRNIHLAHMADVYDNFIKLCTTSPLRAGMGEERGLRYAVELGLGEGWPPAHKNR
jgi:hypothetical protein